MLHILAGIRYPLNIVKVILIAVYFLSLSWDYTFPFALRTGIPATSFFREEAFSELDADDLIFTDVLGTVKYSGEESPGKIDFYIQDINCTREFQSKIAEIIEYLHDKYEGRERNLEGVSGDYDLSMLTNIPDAGIRRNISEYFVDSMREVEQSL